MTAEASEKNGTGNPIEVVVSPETAARLVALQAAVQTAENERDAFIAGLCFGLGIERERILSLDPARGVLVLRDA